MRFPGQSPAEEKSPACIKIAYENSLQNDMILNILPILTTILMHTGLYILIMPSLSFDNLQFFFCNIRLP